METKGEEKNEIQEEPTKQLFESLQNPESNLLYSDDSNSDDDDELVKLEDVVDNDILYKFHPEIKNINNTEMESKIKIKRNGDDKIIDEEHSTLPIMTRYEKAKILGIRSTQINSGAEPFIDVPSSIIDGITIARMELEKKAIPFVIRRNLPNGKTEYWNIEDLEIL